MATASDKTGPAPTKDGISVVAAVDFSEDSMAALKWAGHYADRIGARLLVLHVVHDPAEAPGSYRRSDQDVLRPMEDVADQMMAAFLEEARAANPDIISLSTAEPTLVTGLPASRILAFAEDHEAIGIVMGSRGRTGLPQLLLGSTSQRVAQLSAIPVTIIKGEPMDV